MGIQNHIMFVIGLAGENRESVENTIRFIKSVPCHSVQFSVAVPFPGTSLYRDAEAKGHLITKDWSKYNGFDHVVVRTDELSAEGVGQALARARRSVYFSPRFIKNRLSYIRNPRDVSALARKALRLMTRSPIDRVG
jgi:anaerobic magnesium-protoporphyrin IX monomethyl ester cyclase